MEKIVLPIFLMLCFLVTGCYHHETFESEELRFAYEENIKVQEEYDKLAEASVKVKAGITVAHFYETVLDLTTVNLEPLAGEAEDTNNEGLLIKHHQIMDSILLQICFAEETEDIEYIYMTINPAKGDADELELYMNLVHASILLYEPDKLEYIMRQLEFDMSDSFWYDIEFDTNVNMNYSSYYDKDLDTLVFFMT